ncbi:hypothetical protein [Bacillus sp. Marseille-P3661]|uniref:hypothetical protein n=1 Tax=Bacillus sp. Marseille-P3661 TaxID=1936234 RepID=UPI000C859C5D|nr:hypothetical protein [Bacillus sp. Marseille-P3661]
MLVRELFKDSLLYEESFLAHCLFHLLNEKKYSLDDDISQIDLHQVDYYKVAEMVQKDVLGIQRVNIYSLKMDEKTFVFIYARSQEEATQLYIQYFQRLPMNCHDYPLEFEIVRGKGKTSFREMRKEFDSFPAIAGILSRD